jgi:diguanylate cyclase (GGDEF)-like protein/PAS domain S-box-containing protein
MSFNLIQFINEYEGSFHEVFDLIPIPLFAKDIQGKYIACNKAYEDISGLSRKELLGRNVYDLWPKQQADLFSSKDNELFDNPGEQKYETDISSSFGKTCIVQFHKVTFVDGKNKTIGLLGSVFDLTEKIELEKSLKKANEKLSKMAMHDPLTSLPNRRYFREYTENKLAQAKRDSDKIAFLYIDLDGFKPINDKISHQAGDQVLISLAERFNQFLRKNEFIARVGGDEFCMVVYNYKDKEELENTAKRLIDKTTQALIIGGIEIKIGMTIGIASYPKNGKTYDELLSSADVAMYDAKNKERGTYIFAR